MLLAFLLARIYSGLISRIVFLWILHLIGMLWMLWMVRDPLGPKIVQGFHRVQIQKVSAGY